MGKKLSYDEMVRRANARGLARAEKIRKAEAKREERIFKQAVRREEVRYQKDVRVEVKRRRKKRTKSKKTFRRVLRRLI